MLGRLIVFSGICTGLFTGLICSANAFGADLKVGFVVPLTGAEVEEGKIQIRALNLAFKQVNAAGGVQGKKLQLVTADNQSSNPGSVEAFQKLAADTEIIAIFAPVKSPQVIAMLPMIVKAGIPTFTGATNMRILTEAKGIIFRARPNDSLLAYAMLAFLKDDLKLNRVAIFHDSDSFGSGGGNMLEKHARDLDIKVVKRASWAPEDQDFKSHLDSFKKADAQAMVVYSNKWKTLGQIQIQQKVYRSGVAYIGNPSNVQKLTLGVAKAGADGVYGVTDAAPGETKANRDFISAFKAEYGEEPELSQSWPYDLAQILALAIKQVGADRSKIREAVMSIKNYDGMMGKISFDSLGEGLHDATIVNVDAGKLRMIKIVHEP